MNTQETILQLEGLKLKGMAGCYKTLQGMPVNQWPTLDTFMARLAEAEQQYRNRKRTEMYLKTSKLRYNAVMEDVICSEERNLNKEMLRLWTAPSLTGRRIYSLTARQDAESPSWHVLSEGRHASWDTEWNTFP